MAVKYRIRRSDNAIVLGPYAAEDSVAFRVDFPPAGSHTYHIEVAYEGPGGNDIVETALVGLVIKR